MWKFIGTWAALGLVLSGATQLRVAGLPIGPAEGVLAAWILFFAWLLLRGFRFTLDRVSRIFVFYWLASFALLGTGSLVAVATDNFDAQDAAHDATAFAYISVLTMLLALRPPDDPGSRYHTHMARMVFLFHTVCLVLLFSFATGAATLGPLNLWFGPRFRGWAANPNQMALAVAALPFLGWYLLRQSSGRARQAGYVLAISCCIWVGIASKSDGLRVAWLTAFSVTGALLWLRVVLRGRTRWLYVSHVIVPFLIVFGALSFGDAFVDYAYRAAEGIYEERDQGAKRFTQWFSGLEVIAQSPLVGFGPGSFSGGEPFQGHEAHNSFIDWGMSTGGIGLLLHFSLLGWCFWRTTKAESLVPLGMLTAVVVCSVFSYLFRHPMYWLILVLSMVWAERRAESGTLQTSRGAAGPQATGTHVAARGGLATEPY